MEYKNLLIYSRKYGGGCGIQIILYRRAKAMVYGGRPLLHFLIDYKL
jgi:hypothetical protein|tara:strand:- start:20 stop:160 length:141 start_codon:yes stop_codon:yes gene_type:complete